VQRLVVRRKVREDPSRVFNNSCGDKPYLRR
jgi:hypothetical protein